MGKALVRLGGLALVCLLAAQFGCAALRGDGSPPAAGSPAADAALEAVRPSLVKVEYWLRYDKGEAPSGGSFGQRCPSCGQYHDSDASDIVKSERPIEQPGFLISGNRVVSADPVLESRFIAKIVVKKHEQSVDARFAAFSRTGKAAILELGEPLTNASPLVFDGSATGPHTGVSYSPGNGDWNMSASPFSPPITYREYGQPFRTAGALCVVVDKSGKPLTITPGEELPADDSWKTPPEKWDLVGAADVEQLLSKTQAVADAGIVRVTLNFRSPRAQESLTARYRQNEDEATVQHVLGIVVDPQTVLVLTELKPNVTSRLEKIRIFPPNGPPMSAEFIATLTDYGALVVKPTQPLAGGVQLSGADPRPMQTALLPAARIYMQGETRVCYLGHRRISGNDIGWRQNVYPELPGDSKNVFLFDPDGRLLAFPISTREKASTKSEYSYSQNDAKLTSGAQLRPVLANLSAHADAGNVPLTEDEENRLAWLGVELQPLTAELARANNVSSLTNDGDSGALVTYVYENSPAARAGIAAGAVLLRVHVAEQPKPIDIEVDASPYGDQPFPWEKLDLASEEFYDRIPQPWPTAENTFTRTLTDLGFGSAFTLEYFMDGKTQTRDFVVEQSPPHFNAAARAKSEALGVTVREITYEVRRYMQRKPDEPGVVISKIEMGSKASKAGLKPFEVITHVNDAPVNNVGDFERLVQGQDELRLTIKRMTKGRIVKITLVEKKASTAPKPPPATAPATQPS